MIDPGTRDVYARATLGGRLPFGKRPAVLVVDLSRGFTDPERPLGSDVSPVIDATRRVLDSARSNSVPVIFTTIGYERNLKDCGLWLYKGAGLAELVLGGPWVDIDPRLERQDDETVIVKKGASAFFGTTLMSVLTAEGVDSLIICGVSTSGCVRASAVDAMHFGIPAMVPRECVGDRAEGPHEASLFDMDAKYADVVSVDDALLYLQEVAGVASPAGQTS
ncbi:isochorismatase family protein [Arthrobacter sp. KNU40]|uniref:isochorismatase family protein n=1 Tax=Arthrobacter sp. KNU40 TaxID=3447965 RepID=UPI003F6308DD